MQVAADRLQQGDEKLMMSKATYRQLHALVLVGRAHDRCDLRRVAVPRVGDAVAVADGFDFAGLQRGDFPAGTEETSRRWFGDFFKTNRTL